jgi:hypothetical protein
VHFCDAAAKLGLDHPGAPTCSVSTKKNKYVGVVLVLFDLCYSYKMKVCDGGPEHSTVV